VETYVDCGVDILELGVPGAYPSLDGPTIATSLARAAEAGVGPESAAELIAGHRRAFPDVAMVWMTYPATPTPAPLVDLAAACGVDGVLFPGSASRFPAVAAQLVDRGIHFVHFLSHDSALRDLEAAARDGRGYVMLQATRGTTGTKVGALSDSTPVIATLRRLGLAAPIALGIGISTPEHARQAIGMGADGVVVGSATVEAALRGERELRAFLGSLRRALDA
jgi:tryptophan synthase alpha chain